MTPAHRNSRSALVLAAAASFLARTVRAEDAPPTGVPAMVSPGPAPLPLAAPAPSPAPVAPTPAAPPEAVDLAALGVHDESAASGESERPLQLYGFADFTYYVPFFPRDSFLAAQIPENQRAAENRSFEERGRHGRGSYCAGHCPGGRQRVRGMPRLPRSQQLWPPVQLSGAVWQFATTQTCACSVSQWLASKP